MYTYFITPNDVKDLTNISDNLSEKYILTAIREAQQTELTQVLGIHFITKLEEAVNKGEVPERYSELLDNYILYFLCYNVISKLIPIASVKIDNAGAVTTGDEKVENLSLDEVFRLQDYYSQKSDYYKMRLQRYLVANRTKYPELDCTSEIHSAYSSPIFLGGKRGKHVIRPCHGVCGHISPEKPDTPEKPYYEVLYTVDGYVHDFDSYQEGERIIPAVAPEKDGYTFQYWEGLPEYMPANDITVTAVYHEIPSGEEPAEHKIDVFIEWDYLETRWFKVGERIELPEPPVREGYTFVSWNSIVPGGDWFDMPEYMPDYDFEVHASYTVNSYKLTYKVDGEIVSETDVEYGAGIVAMEAPTKEGYTFSGWSEIPETMPAHDVEVTGSFTINSYKLVYKVDGEVVSEENIEYGTGIVAMEEPVKEGHTFSGWSEIPETMPAHDVEVTGSFTINSYKLVYKVDGEVVSEENVEYGTEINTIEAPTKEGYTFSGWIGVPATMPANDVEINGSFTVNSYRLTYVMYDENGDVYLEEYVTYRYTDVISPYLPDIPDGYTFNGWDNEPAVMPAHDVTVTGRLVKNIPDIPSDYSSQYTTFEALTDGVFSFTKRGTGDDIQYSKDNGTTWTPLASGETVSVVEGDKVMWKSTITPSASSSPYGIGRFATSCDFKVYGNIMSLAYGDGFIGQTSLEGKNYIFYELFNKCAKLTDASNLILPATKLSKYCYRSMFCEASALATAPELPATTLANDCYSWMFYDCKSLTAAPELPATTLAKNCYSYMFRGCTKLTTAPELPATTLTGNCYNSMFNSCSKLNHITMLATDISATSCLFMWVGAVSSTGTFVKHPDMTTLPTGNSGIPTGWTVENK